MFLLALCNVLGLYFLAKVIRKEFSDYWTGLHDGDFAEIPPRERFIFGAQAQRRAANVESNNP